MREAQPSGILGLDLDDDARVEQEQIAENNRKLTPTENVAEWLRGWLNDPAESQTLEMPDGETFDPDEDDGLFIRNMVTLNRRFPYST